MPRLLVILLGLVVALGACAPRLVDRGDTAMARQQYDEAAALYARALASDPENATLRAKLDRARLFRCRQLDRRAGDAGPYTRALVARYCAGAGGERVAGVEAPALPQAFSRIEIDVAIEGLSAAANEQIGAAVRDELMASPWFDPDADGVARVRARGASAVAIHEVPRRRTATWSVSVPYRTTEHYQQAYTATETYTEMESYTTTETTMGSCGFGTSSYTCPTTRPVTRTRPVTKTRTVTKYRPATRWVTRYRLEPREQSYDVLAHEGTYEIDVRLNITTPVWRAPMEVRFSRAEFEYADEHGVSIPEAGVAPSYGTLPSVEAWALGHLPELWAEVGERGSARWAARHCARPSFDLESAARCAWGGGPIPEHARAPLATLFGEDEVDGAVARGR